MSEEGRQRKWANDKHPLRGVVIPAQHGWFAVYESGEGNGRWAIPVIAWKYYDMEDGDNSKEHICGDALLAPSEGGLDLASDDDKQFVGYRWMPSLYSTPQNEGVSQPFWDLDSVSKESDEGQEKEQGALS